MRRVELCVVGGGRMGAALVGGLLEAGFLQPAALAVVESDAARRDELSARFTGVRVEAAPVAAEGVVVVVKPHHGAEACAAVAAAGCDRVLSLMAGVTIDSLESWFGAGVPVVRAMPNTPALVGAGVAAVSAGRAAAEADLAWAEHLLRAVGSVVRVPEEQLDAVTGLSGSGPAYVFYVTEALTEAGVAAGLPEAVAAALAVATVSGSGRLLAETGADPAELRAQVTSPGGTTEAGLRVLGERGVREAFVAAVAAAAGRSRELGRPGTG